jgi:hypothetical protein
MPPKIDLLGELYDILGVAKPGTKAAPAAKTAKPAVQPAPAAAGPPPGFVPTQSGQSVVPLPTPSAPPTFKQWAMTEHDLDVSKMDKAAAQQLQDLYLKKYSGQFPASPTSIMAQPAGQQAVAALKAKSAPASTVNPLEPYWGKKPGEVPFQEWNKATTAQKKELYNKYYNAPPVTTPKPLMPIGSPEPGTTYLPNMSFDQYAQAKGFDQFAATPKQVADEMLAYYNEVQAWKKVHPSKWTSAEQHVLDLYKKNAGVSTLTPQQEQFLIDTAKQQNLIPGMSSKPAFMWEKEPTAPPERVDRPLPAANEAFRKEFNIPGFHGTDKIIPTSEGYTSFKEFKNPEDLPAKSYQLGIHFGTAQSAHDIHGLATSEAPYSASTGAHIFPLRARAHKPLELRDLGSWESYKVAPALIAKGFPEAEVHAAEAKGIKGLRQYIESKGYDSVRYENDAEHPGSYSYIVWDPSRLRVPWANFDPKKKDFANLMAGIGGGIILPAAMVETSDQAEAAEAGPPPGFVPVQQNGPPPGFVPVQESETLGGAVAQQYGKGVEKLRGERAAEARGERKGVGGFAQEFMNIAGGMFDMATSPVTGAIRHYGAPLAGSKPAVLEGERPGLFQPFKNPISGAAERARQSAARPFGAQGTREEQLERMTDTLSAFVPGMGLVGGPKALYNAAGKVAGKIGSSAVGRTFEEIFSPTTVDADSRIAEAIIRGTGGRAARDTSQAAAAMEPFHATINAMPEAARLDFIDHVEGGPAKIAALPPPLQTLATAMRNAFEQRKAKLQSLPETSGMAFIDDYFPHMWQDPGAATTFAEQFKGGAGKQGSGASLHKRTIPTIADGIAAGLKPISTDPIEMATRYVTSMDRFIASQSSLEIAKRIGQVKYIRPRVMGASGHPDSFKVPDGWVPLNGRGSRNAAGAQAYAPEGFARVYNNYIGRGVHELGPEYGRVYDAVQRTSNAITGLELGLSGYHAITMANEANISRLATGIKEIVGGAGAGDAMRLLRGAGKAATSPVGFLTSPLRGRQMEQVYLGQTTGSPDMARVVNLLEKAGGRGVGARHAQDYRFSAQGSYWKAWRQGALKMQMATAAADIKAHPIVGTARQAASVIGRTMSTVAAPLFETYIPRLKNGAFYDAMKEWLDANPAATYEAQVRQARQVWDSIDNRFGELVDDNIFWNQLLKQAAKLGMRSYSWNLGTAREIGGGVADIARGQFSDRAAYVIALPMMVGTMNAVYQKLKTGKNPESVQDLVAGQTGGEQTTTIPSTQPYHRSAKSTVPERVQIPGYQKDVMGWYENWQQEMLNKRSKMVSMGMELASNQDWRGDPIFNPEDSAPEWLKQAMKYMVDSFTPISIQGPMKGRKEGSNIGTPEQMGGLRPAPAYVSDPEGYERQQRNIHILRQKKKAAFDKKQERAYGGTE